MGRNTPVGGLLWPSLRALQIWGANTDVGKTIFSTILCLSVAAKRHKEGVFYLKPVSTGSAEDADTKHVRAAYLGLRKLMNGTQLEAKTIAQYDIPVSPHIAAAESEKGGISDQELLAAIYSRASEYAAAASSPQTLKQKWIFCETAGGVHSPGPSGTSQADLYRPLRLPAILIGDSRLGGISATISSFESLHIRGYDVESVLLFENETYRNYDYLKSYFEERGIPCTALRPPPARDQDPKKDTRVLHAYYSEMARSHNIRNVLKDLNLRHERRIKSLETMAEDAQKTIWYPFTQQKLLTADKITAIDSAYGDHFQTFSAKSQAPKELDGTSPHKVKGEGQSTPLLRPSFDGSASWWTQGLGHANPQLTLAAAYAAGRYGHVMFAEAIHQPALKLAKTLIEQLDNPRLSRVFYSDNGSTGIEVATKMALRAARLRYSWGPRENLSILGLKGSYHGDTIGAMDCSEPGTYNEKIEWYKGKGYWFDFPTVKMTNGKWKVDVPGELKIDGSSAGVAEFSGLHDIFDLKARQNTETYQDYTRYISRTLESLRDQGFKFGALMLEPVVLGAGGMMLVDPLFQRALVDVVRNNPELFSHSSAAADVEDDRTWTGLPVIFDEVFTGLYRLGSHSSARLLGVNPDITVHAKLLTGGLIPLAATVASESIFRCFESDDKSDALLHGHSYTAHAIGCQVAIETLATMERMEKQRGWRTFEDEWANTAESPLLEKSNDEQRPAVWSVWSRKFVRELSTRTDQVEGLWALGSVLAIHFKDATGSGYKSNASRALQAELLKGDKDIAGSNVHSRVLGNVLYLMTSQTTDVATVRHLEQRLLNAEALGGDPV
ncbi:hypothetical protein N8I77_000493 [Diaporthe amygdali]|uniref:Uncharacterized protein n=1 Tax=Phomopsis amygdali TaxID=1214568 RepID=A0AAD9SPP4_PHOAM|nr:hypothetical protein N8I77_000493 [Diaporthe amygdali]